MPPSVFLRTSLRKTSSPANGFAMRGEKVSTKTHYSFSDFQSLVVPILPFGAQRLEGEVPVAPIRCEGRRGQ